jgi:hypothetical protein
LVLDLLVGRYSRVWVLRRGYDRNPALELQPEPTMEIRVVQNVISILEPFWTLV